MGRFLLGKGILKAVKRAIVAGGSTGIITAVTNTGDTDKLNTALVTVATWVISLLMDYLKHRK